MDDNILLAHRYNLMMWYVLPEPGTPPIIQKNGMSLILYGVDKESTFYVNKKKWRSKDIKNRFIYTRKIYKIFYIFSV